MNVQVFNQYLELEGIQEMIALFLEKGEVRTFARDRVFVREGQKSDFVGYVAEGGFRHLIQTTDGRERVSGYSFVGDFISAFPAFSSKNSAVTIQAFRDSTVYMLNKSWVESLQSWEFRFRVMEISLSDVYGRLLLMHRGTPEERYRSLIGRYPAILNEVSLKEIASFLRMTPETLSRIRRKILQNEFS